MTPIKRAVFIVGSQKKLAEILNVTPGMVSQWVRGTREVGAIHCGRVEGVTHGLVTREQLRPDVFYEVVYEVKAA